MRFCGNLTIENMTVSMNQKFDKYWSDIQGLMGIATLLDPRFKSEMLLVCYEMLLSISTEECENHVQQVTTSLCNLMDECRVANEEDNTESSVPLSAIEAPVVMLIFNARVAKKRP